MVPVHCVPPLVPLGGRNELHVVRQWAVPPVQVFVAALQERLPAPPSTTAEKDYQHDMRVPVRAQ